MKKIYTIFIIAIIFSFIVGINVGTRYNKKKNKEIDLIQVENKIIELITRSIRSLEYITDENNDNNLQILNEYMMFIKEETAVIEELETILFKYSSSPSSPSGVLNELVLSLRNIYNTVALGGTVNGKLYSVSFEDDGRLTEPELKYLNNLKEDFQELENRILVYDWSYKINNNLSSSELYLEIQEFADKYEYTMKVDNKN